MGSDGREPFGRVFSETEGRTLKAGCAGLLAWPLGLSLALFLCEWLHSEWWKLTLSVLVATLLSSAVGSLLSPRSPWAAGLIPLAVWDVLLYVFARGVGGFSTSGIVILELVAIGFLPGLLVVLLFALRASAQQTDG